MTYRIRLFVSMARFYYKTNAIFVLWKMEFLRDFWVVIVVTSWWICRGIHSKGSNKMLVIVMNMIEIGCKQKYRHYIRFRDFYGRFEVRL